MNKEQFEELTKEDWTRVSQQIERFKTSMKFYKQTVGDGVNGGSSSYANVVIAGNVAHAAAYDLIQILERIGIK